MIVYKIVLIFFALLLLIAVSAVLYSFGENERLKSQLEAARRGKARYAEIGNAYAQIINDNALTYSERLAELDKRAAVAEKQVDLACRYTDLIIEAYTGKEPEHDN